MTINVEQGFVILEGASGAVEEWCNVLHIDQAFVASLVTQGVFQRSRTTDGQSRLRLNMVGLLATQQKAFFCLPKICVGHDIDIPANMQCALTAIQTYQRHRSEEHTSELQSLMRISYAVFCLKKKKQHRKTTN